RVPGLRTRPGRRRRGGTGAARERFGEPGGTGRRPELLRLGGRPAAPAPEGRGPRGGARTVEGPAAWHPARTGAGDTATPPEGPGSGSRPVQFVPRDAGPGRAAPERHGGGPGPVAGRAAAPPGRLLDQLHPGKRPEPAGAAGRRDRLPPGGAGGPAP